MAQQSVLPIQPAVSTQGQEVITQQSVSNQQSILVSHSVCNQGVEHTPSPVKTTWQTSGTNLCKTPQTGNATENALLVQQSQQPQQPQLKQLQEIKFEIVSDDKNEPEIEPNYQADDMSGKLYVNTESGKIEAVTIDHRPR